MPERATLLSLLLEQALIDVRVQKPRSSPARGGTEYIRKLFYDGRRITRVDVSSAMQFFTHGATLLDIGCGYGNFTTEIERKFPVKAFGIDIDRSRLLQGNNSSHVVCASWTAIPFPDDFFSRLVSCESFPRYPTFRTDLPPEEEIILTQRTLDELARVSQQDTLWRGILPHSPDSRNRHLYVHNPTLVNNLPAMMNQSGWKITSVKDKIFCAVLAK